MFKEISKKYFYWVCKDKRTLVLNNKLVTILTHKPLQRLAHNPRTTKVLACSLMLAPVAISAGKDIFEKESVQEQRLLRPQLVPANTELFT